MSIKKLETQIIQVIQDGDFDDQIQSQMEGTCERRYIDLSCKYDDTELRFTDIDIYCNVYYKRCSAEDGQWLELDSVEDIQIYADKTVINCKSVDVAVAEKICEYAISCSV